MKLNDKIYVAGHNGMLGSAIIRQLKEKGYNNIITRSSSELDLTNQKKVDTFLKDEKVDVIILAAAKVGTIEENKNYPAEFLVENLQIETNVINSAYKNNIQNLLFIASSCVYPDTAKQPLKEEYLLTGKLEPENEAYGLSKIIGLKLCEYYNKEYNMDYITVLPTNIYGKNDKFDPKHSHIITGVMTRMHNAKINNLPNVNIWGTGNIYREFLYVDDAADAIIFLLENYKGNEFLNLGTGTDITIKDVVKIIKDVVGYTGKLKFDTTKPDGIYRRQLDMNKLSSLGWKPKTELKEGIKKTYKWYLDNIIK
ncbi:MAG: GDP-L-fucose synthase [Methanobacteriaceae archaeon]|nr:GDP-L-fucose synthase [Methanobacteriaceae archaeon]